MTGQLCLPRYNILKKTDTLVSVPGSSGVLTPGSRCLILWSNLFVSLFRIHDTGLNISWCCQVKKIIIWQLDNNQANPIQQRPCRIRFKSKETQVNWMSNTAIISAPYLRNISVSRILIRCNPYYELIQHSCTEVIQVNSIECCTQNSQPKKNSWKVNSYANKHKATTAVHI